MDVIEQYKQQYKGAYNGALSESAVVGILHKFAISDECYRNWLIQTGGGPVGSDWLDGIDELIKSQEKLRSEPWSISGFVIGWDGAGNPIVIAQNGEIKTEDHNFGGVHVLASNFNELLAKHVSS